MNGLQKGYWILAWNKPLAWYESAIHQGQSAMDVLRG